MANPNKLIPNERHPILKNS